MRIAAVVIVLAGCACTSTPAVVMGVSPTCKFGAAKIGAPLADSALVELSGLVASRAHPGVLYAHNDSGDTARFFALGPEAQALGRFELEGAAANDWEDMTLGPCPAGTCVFLGDIGDNRRVRTDYAIYRVQEPQVAVGSPVDTVKVTWERFPFAYPNGEKHNAETLFVHPLNGELYVATKQAAGEPSVVFKFPGPLDASATATLIRVAQLAVPEVKDQALTGGSLSPDGTSLLLRMYNRLVELKLPAGAPFEQIFTARSINVPVITEQQGEAVAWKSDGRGYFTASEEAGVKPTLNRVECQP